MTRDDYAVFSAGNIGRLTLSNRLVRSATWDPSILIDRRMTDEVLHVYEEVAGGGVGMIITGDFPVVPQGAFDGEDTGRKAFSYDDAEIEGISRLVSVVRRSSTDCKIVAQLSDGQPGAGPSDVPSPFWEEPIRPLTAHEIRMIVGCFVEAILKMKACGFDGVQLHAAHGTLLSCFLSPYMNRRDDAYGGPAANRARIVSEIVTQARAAVGDYPILIKLNCTDYLEGGTDIDSFPELAGEIERAGVDAIEISGGMWDCLARTEDELGFRPVPAPESHTRIGSPARQSYFLKYAEALNLGIPVILVGGNRDVERLEQIVRQGAVDFIALCRPLVSEPDLPRRWLEGRGGSGTDCISCNACIYSLPVHPRRPHPGVATCLFKHDREQHRMAQQWLSTWVNENLLS